MSDEQRNGFLAKIERLGLLPIFDVIPFDPFEKVNGQLSARNPGLGLSWSKFATICEILGDSTLVFLLAGL